MVDIETKKYYNTQQREIVLNYLINNTDKCLTVSDIYKDLLNNGAIIGEATVYRQLRRFISEGIVIKLIDGEGKGAYYRYIKETNDNHFHLKCIECAEIIHMKCEFIKYLDQHILSDHDFHIDEGRTIIYGICGNCKKRHPGYRKEKP